MVAGLPRKPGSVAMGATDGSGRSGTFVYPDDKSEPVNMATDKGQVVIEEVTDQTIKGTVTLKFDDANFIDGAFIVSTDQGFLRRAAGRTRSLTRSRSPAGGGWGRGARRRGLTRWRTGSGTR